MKFKVKIGAAAPVLILSGGFCQAQEAAPRGGQVDGPGPDGAVCAVRTWRGPMPSGAIVMRPGGGLGRRGFGSDGFLRYPMIRQRLGITAEQSDKIEQPNIDARKAQICSRADLERRPISTTG